MKSCCLSCEHCDALDQCGDLVLCCMLQGEENPVQVNRDNVCKDYSPSIFADCILFDGPNQTKEIVHEKPKLKPIPEFLKACPEGRPV